MTGPFAFNMSCPCDPRLAGAVHDVIKRAARDAGRDESAAEAVARSADEFLQGCFARGVSEGTIQVHVKSDAVELQAAGETLSIDL